MHSGQADTLATVLLLSIIVVSSLSAYTFFQSFQSNVQTSSSSSTQQIQQLPPNIESAYTQPPTESKKTTALCSVIRNPNDYNIQLSNITLYLYKDDTLILTEDNTSNDCNSIVPPKGVCKVCADVIIPEEGTYTYKFVYGSAPISSKTLKVPEEHVSLYPDLIIQSISAYQNHYDSKTLLFGDYNSFTVNVTVCNDGRDDMNTTATLTLSSTNASLSQTTFTIPVLSPSECNTFTTTGTTTSPSNVTITAKVDYPDTELKTGNNTKSIAFVNAYYLECSDKSTCESSLSDALNFVNNSDTDNNAYVVLTADIEDDYIQFPSGDYKWRVVFDGNGHEVNHDPECGKNATYVLRLIDVNDIDIRNVSATACEDTVYLYHSSISLQDVNAYAAGTYVIYLEAYSSVILRTVNATANWQAIYSYCYGCTNKLNVDLSNGNTTIYAFQDASWYIDAGDLNVSCLNCGNGYYLCTPFSDHDGHGTLNPDCDCNQPCW